MIKSALLMAGSLCLTLPAAAAVDGKYASGCQVMEMSGVTLVLDFESELPKLTQVQRVFLDTSCKSAGYDLVITGPYELDETSGALDYTLDTVTLTPLSAQVASAFNIQKLCGISTWTMGKETSIAGLTCGGQEMPAAGTVSYDIVQEVEGGIQTGKPTDSLDGTTAEKRPTEIDSSITYMSID